jgi:hypothetical protein
MRSALRRAARETGSHRLPIRAYEAWLSDGGRGPAVEEVLRTWGSWSLACRDAELARKPYGPVPRGEVSSRADALPHLHAARAYTLEHPRAGAVGTPARNRASSRFSSADYQRYALATSSAPPLERILALWGAWPAAAQAAGAEAGTASRRRLRPSPENERGVRIVAEIIGHAPSVRDYIRHRPRGFASAQRISRAYGGWAAVLRSSGIDPARRA